MEKTLVTTTSPTSGTTLTFSQIAEHIYEYIVCPFTDYAILLDGRWGCGKSYFITTNLGKDWEDVKMSVVSLNGVQSLQELDTLIFMSRHLPKGAAPMVAAIPQAISDPHVALDMMRNVFPLISKKTFWKGLLDRYLDEDNAKESKHKINKKKRLSELLVVDDLERHSRNLAVEDILGHLHERYVLKGTRILFVCDEKEIGDKIQFAKCKEKYIRREYRFPEFDETLLFDVINVRYCTSDKHSQEVKTIVSDIIRLAKQFGVSNLRTICTIMDDYVELVKKLNDPQFFKTIGPYVVEHMFPLYIERCNGWLSAKDLINYGNLDQLDIVDCSNILKRVSGGASTPDSKQNLTYPEEFALRYETLPHRWRLRKPVFRFVIGNELDKEAFVKSFCDRLTAEEPARKSLETVLAFYEYDEEPLMEAISTVLAGIDSDKYSYRELVQLPRVFGQIKKHNYVSSDIWSKTLMKRIFASIHRMAVQPMSGAEAESLLQTWTVEEIKQSDNTEEQMAIINEVRSIARQSRMSEFNSKLDKLFTALKTHNTKDIWENYPVGDSETELLVRFVEAGYADCFAQLGTYGLRWLSQHVQRHLIHMKFDTSVKPIVEAIEEIVRSIHNAIASQVLTKPQESRLSEFIDVLKEAREHLLKQPGMNIEPA